MPNNDAERLWESARAHLQVQLSRSEYNTWVREAVLVAHEDGAFIIGVPNFFAKEWLRNRLHGRIKRSLEEVAGHSVDVTYIVHTPPNSSDEGGDAGPLMEGNADVHVVPHPQAMPLNPRYLFETFIVGSSNRMAHAAALAVADRPGRAYNPLFLYGGVGLGKTHLLQAVGHVALAAGYRVLYVSSETFTNDLINAIRAQTTDQFRARYRSVDVLLIDDIQFIAGKESTQEEFFHTFNALHAAGKQICITSDRSPREIATLEERLRSRFQGGIIADIRPPDFETRLAILRARAERTGAIVSDAVLVLIAERVDTNIRELEGILNRVVAHTLLSHEPLTTDQVQHILDEVAPAARTLHPEEILRAVVSYFHVSQEELESKGRSRSQVVPRQVAMYLLRTETNLSFPQIGRLLGGRDHTTVMHGYEKIAARVEHDLALKRQLAEIRELATRVLVPAR